MIGARAAPGAAAVSGAAGSGAAPTAGAPPVMGALAAGTTPTRELDGLMTFNGSAPGTVGGGACRSGRWKEIKGKLVNEIKFQFILGLVSFFGVVTGNCRAVVVEIPLVVVVGSACATTKLL